MKAAMNNRWLSVLGCLLITTGLQAQDPVVLESREDLVDAWSALMYCQSALREPEVSGRVYPGDLERCDEAGQVLVDRLKPNYEQKELATMRQEAAAKARAAAITSPSDTELIRPKSAASMASIFRPVRISSMAAFSPI